MNREIFYKLIRVAIFPFRFAYLIVYQWRMNRARDAHRAAQLPGTSAGPDATPPTEHSEEIGDRR
jgi:hypothetical protein